MTRRPLVSAVTVNWNGAEHLRIALPSLRAQTYSRLEIIVVDNDSQDDSHTAAVQCGATWIGLPTNIGLSPACNRGASVARGEYLVFLNNDMRFAPDFIEQLVNALVSDETVFATDALQYDWAGIATIHQATRLRERGLLSSYLQPGLLPMLDVVQDAASAPVVEFQACAAAMAVRRSMFEHLGGFDERLPIGWEDSELCWRAWMNGWKSVFVPTAVCWHRVGASERDNRRGSATRARGTIGGRLLFATKLLPPRHALHAWVISCLGLTKDLLKGRFAAVASKARVLAEFGRMVPSLLAERRRIYRAAAVTPSGQLLRLLHIDFAPQPDVTANVIAGTHASRPASHGTSNQC